MRSRAAPLALDMVQLVVALVAPGFVVWVLACVVRGYALAKASHLPARSGLDFSTLRGPVRAKRIASTIHVAGLMIMPDVSH